LQASWRFDSSFEIIIVKALFKSELNKGFIRSYLGLMVIYGKLSRISGEGSGGNTRRQVVSEEIAVVHLVNYHAP